MKKLTILIVWACYCLYFPAFCQTSATTKYLKIGDKMPELKIPNVINAKQKTLDLGQLKGKVVLLDFWTTYCSSCIEGFEELDSLQKAYPDKLKIILVDASTNDSKRGVDLVISRTRSWSPYGFKLPIVYPDLTLRPYFKFRGVPHIVWIGPDGTILAFTDKKAVNARNIEMAMSGMKLNLKEKTD